MKKNIATFLLVMGVVLMSQLSFAQETTILSETDEYDYLIGVEYSEPSEIEGLKFMTRGGFVKKGVGKYAANFSKENNQIVTSEIVKIEDSTSKRVYKILDVVVLKDHYAPCTGCLLSKEKGTTVVSFHKVGNKSRESIVLVLEKNNETGKFTEVDHSDYKWNPKYDILKKR